MKVNLSLSILLTAVSPTTAIVGVLLNDYRIIFLGVIILFAQNCFHGAKMLKQRAFFLAFHVTFFVFLLGTIFFEFIENFAFDVRGRIHPDLNLHISLCLYMSLFCLRLGLWVAESTSYLNSSDIVYGERDLSGVLNGTYILYVRKISLYLFYTAYPFYLLEIISKVSFVQTHGYLAFYVAYVSWLPFIMLAIGGIAEISLFLFLASSPSNRQAMMPLMLYLASSILSLGWGRRNPLGLAVLFIICYACLRNGDYGETWLGIKEKMMVAIAAPALMVFFVAWGYIRNSVQFDYISLFDSISRFFQGQGISVIHIGYATYGNAIFPEGTIYSLNAIKTYLTNNRISGILLPSITTSYATQSMESVDQSGAFSVHIAYYLLRDSFFAGRGLGSCYIAEAFLDFGYWGVAVVNALYGFILGKVAHVSRHRPVLLAFFFASMQELLIAPRASASSFVVESLQIKHLIVAAAVWFVASRINSRSAGVCMEPLKNGG